ncbi:MAG: flagellar basal body rod protein FlgB [Bdellovibrionales bacterium]|nr:flagellar basal body rod protein FlgB [Bdellovibrionales bacterium]
MRIIDSMIDKNVDSLGKVLDLRWRRQQALTSNISNAETPGYRATDLTFAGELQQAFNNDSSNGMLKTNPKHLDLNESSSAHLVPDLTGATRADGNNVDLDTQMGKLMLNTSAFERESNVIQKKLRMLRMAIQYSQR